MERRDESQIIGLAGSLSNSSCARANAGRLSGLAPIMTPMNDDRKKRCREWMIYLAPHALMIAATLALVSLIIPTAHFEAVPLFLLIAGRVYYKLRSPASFSSWRPQTFVPSLFV